MISKATPTTHTTCDQAGLRWRNLVILEGPCFLVMVLSRAANV